MRRLHITVRDVSGADPARADHAWSLLLEAVRSAGGRAWRFRDSAHSHRVMEFIEWSDPASPLDDPAVRDGLDKLERVAPGSRSLWDEAPLPDREI